MLLTGFQDTESFLLSPTVKTFTRFPCCDTLRGYGFPGFFWLLQAFEYIVLVRKLSPEGLGVGVLVKAPWEAKVTGQSA